MNIYLSKVILSGIIATSFMSMSCQKRGTRPSAKLVGGIEKTVQQPDQNQKLQDLPELPNIDTKTQTEVKADEKTSTTPVVQTETPAPTAEKKDETAKADDKKDETASADDDEELTPITLKPKGLIVKSDETSDDTKEDTKATTKDTAKTSDKACSEAVITKSDELDAKYSELVSLMKAKTEEAKMTEAGKAVVDLCREYVALITKYSYNTCDMTTAAGKTVPLNWVKHQDKCLYTGKALQTSAKITNEFATKYDQRVAAQIKALKAASFTVQAAAFELFAAEGTEWQKFASAGQVQSDSRTLIGKADVACSVIGKGIKLLVDNQVSLKILDIKNASIKLDKAVAGVSLKTTVRSQVAQSSADAGTDFAVEIQCTNMSVEHFKSSSIKDAFGKALLVEVKK